MSFQELDDRLVARVRAVNKANDYALQLHTLLTAAFAPFVGKKIYKADGSLLAKVKEAIPELPNTPALSVHRSTTSRYSLVYVVKTCEQVPPHTCVYSEARVYVGDTQVADLVKLSDPPVLRTDYTVEEVTANRAAYRAAKELSDRAQSNLYPFGESDRG